MRGLFDARALLVERLVAGRGPRAAERSPSLGAIWQTWMAYYWTRRAPQARARTILGIKLCTVVCGCLRWFGVLCDVDDHDDDAHIELPHRMQNRVSRTKASFIHVPSLTLMFDY